VANPLVSNYKSSDGRWIALCMLQRDLYWDGLCEAIGRADLLSDPRFTTPEDRTANGADMVAELVKTFETETLAHWREVLARQRGQWDVVRLVSEVGQDPQAVFNGFIQQVDYGQGRALPIVANPVQFDRTPPDIRPAPEFGADTDRVLGALGMDEAAIIDAKISGGVV
jgi:crotonobetainyl-CoA:carnitine CoA-transferase CaiB-like acyl-CoA transferase